MSVFPGVELRTYKIIYDLVDDVRAAMEGRLVTVEERTELGQAEAWPSPHPAHPLTCGLLHCWSLTVDSIS